MSDRQLTANTPRMLAHVVPETIKLSEGFTRKFSREHEEWLLKLKDQVNEVACSVGELDDDKDDDDLWYDLVDVVATCIAWANDAFDTREPDPVP